MLPLNRFFTTRKAKSASPRRPHERSLRVEMLEQRRLLSVGYDTASDGVSDTPLAKPVVLAHGDLVSRYETIGRETNGGPTVPYASFGESVAPIGDLDGDGVGDLAVGAPGDYTGSGGVYILFMNHDGTARDFTRISSETNGGPTLESYSRFGCSVVGLGDLNGDGVADVCVGDSRDSTVGTHIGAIYVLFLDTNGFVKDYQKIVHEPDGPTRFADRNEFGCSVTCLGDLDGDGVTDLAVGALGDRDAGTITSGAVHVLFMNPDGTVKKSTKLSGEMNGVPPLSGGGRFGLCVTSIGDFDADGITDLAVGALDRNQSARGVLHLLLMNSDGTVRDLHALARNTTEWPVVEDEGGAGDLSIAPVGDLNADGVTDLAVGVRRGLAQGVYSGCVEILLMNADGTMKSTTRIGNNVGGGPELLHWSAFGSSVTAIDDINGDGMPELAVGAPVSRDLHVLFMNNVLVEGVVSELAEDSDVSNPTWVADIVPGNAEKYNLSLSGEDASCFEIVGNSLYLMVDVELDFETKPQLDVTLEFDDSSTDMTPDVSISVPIAIIDINEPPTVSLDKTCTTVFTADGAVLDERVADILVTDDALGDDVLILTGTDASLFEVRGTGVYLKAGVIADYGDKNQLDVTVEVDDPELGNSSEDAESLSLNLIHRRVSEIVYVDADSTYDPLAVDAGTSWATAFADLQDALSLARVLRIASHDSIALPPSNGSTETTEVREIWIAEGVYTPSELLDAESKRSAAFTLQDDLALIGGFAGTESSADERLQYTDGPFRHETILSGDIGIEGERRDNASTILFANSVSAGSLDGLIVRDAERRHSYGIPLPNWDGESPLIDYGASYDGTPGTLYATNSHLTLEDVQFIDNEHERDRSSSEAGAAGIHALGGSITIRGGVFARNRYERGGNGGAISLHGASANISDVLFVHNYAGEGGAIRAEDADVRIANCEFLGNFAYGGSGYFGGAIRVEGGTTTISNSIFVHNTSYKQGGALYVSGDASTAVTLDNVTMVDNRSLLNVNSVAVESGTLTLRNSIIVKRPDSYLEFEMRGDYISENCLIETTEPLFVRYPSSGLDEQWGTDDDDFGDLRLLPGCVAIDSGDSALLPVDTLDTDGDGDTVELLPVDLDGDLRVVGAQVDIGAYEFDPNEAPADPPPKDTLYVDVGSAYDPLCPDAGTSWSTAFADLQDALDRAEKLNQDYSIWNDVGEIWVAKGTYVPNERTATTWTVHSLSWPTIWFREDARTAAFSLLDDVCIVGGFAGSETSLGERIVLPDGSFQHETILSGDLESDDDWSDNAYTVAISHNKVNAGLNGVTITGGGQGSYYEANEVSFPGTCSCMHADPPSLNVDSDLRAHPDSGALYVSGGSITLDQVTFRQNWASKSAGALTLMRGVHATIRDSLFLENSSIGGGAIAVGSSTLDITDTTFVRNHANEEGGAIISYYADILIANCQFYGNVAIDLGGAIAAFQESQAVVVNSIFANNSAGGSGGALFLSGDHPSQLINSTLVGNDARYGGGLAIGCSGSVDIGNSIVAGNVGSATPDIKEYDAACFTGSHSLISTEAALFVREPSPGPDGIRGTVDDDNGDLRLLPESPAANAGDASLLPADVHDLDGDGDIAEPLPIDLDGNARVQSGTVDIGAFESPYNTQPIEVSTIVRGVDRPNTWNVQGEASVLPEGESHIDEWTPFYLEIWVTAPQAFAFAAVDLRFDPSLFTAAAIEYGPAFTTQRSGDINNQEGKVHGLGAATTIPGLGTSAQLLLARVLFEPSTEAGAGLDLFETPETCLVPTDSKIRLVDAGAVLEGDIPGSTAASHPATGLWPVPYDYDNSGHVDRKDYLVFRSQYGGLVAADPLSLEELQALASDLDRNGMIDRGDYILFRENYGRSVTDSRPVGDLYGYQAQVPPAAVAEAFIAYVTEAEEDEETIVSDELDVATLDLLYSR